jgi:hypothetical protein
LKVKSETAPDGFDRPFVLVNSHVTGFAAGRDSIADARHIEARYRVEDNILPTNNSIPQGKLQLVGNMSPKTGKQQGVMISIDSSDFGALIELMMKANPKRTIAAISSALVSCSNRWPERHWDALEE